MEENEQLYARTKEHLSGVLSGNAAKAESYTQVGARVVKRGRKEHEPLEVQLNFSTSN
eukprot:m.410158 g.410158  ORF g.410158 m.410158 type:complete len:58 (+) comp20157_c4_seq1:2187-2360(+)